MRKNYPVYDVETKVQEDQYLISKTDLKGRITYANPAFVQISGFTREELIGKAHNVIRHPDMPPAAFQDLWDTLKAGKPWLGLVKNRRKDGGFYWMLANVVPIRERGEVTGYASVRLKPSDEQIAEAQRFHDAINAGQRGYALREGRIVPTGWRRAASLLARPFSRGLKAGLLRAAILLCLPMAAIAWYAAHGGVPAEQGPWLLGAAAVLAAAGLLHGWQTARRFIRPLEGAADIARQVAAGNLDIVIDADPDENGEVGKLYFYLDMMRKSLVGIAADVNAGTDSTARSAAALDTSNAQLAARTEHQASSLRDTADSMEDLTAAVRRNADDAQQARKQAEGSMQTARHGGEVVNEVVSTVKAIHESSRRIGDIVTLIDDIAFQTNILALNAAVESARAGEAGRGFAVVAGEVRALAQKSSAAARDIKVLIDDSVQRISTGSEQAARAGATMGEIVESVQGVTDIIARISQANIAQSDSLDHISQSVSTLEEFTRQNLALANELGDTVAQLGGNAYALRESIAVFNAGGSPGPRGNTVTPLKVAGASHGTAGASREAAAACNQAPTQLPRRPAGEGGKSRVIPLPARVA
ncbi:PAS domain-containing methyl-accepting chemotaxis protein [Allopusillimonas soli]|uniref:PAS domain-containing protein n=1 Tax=Allopusillimonas soli TaxID=659016 RepID=A0A853F5V8_9BURK|nr:PAS domain-containing methyl-accepting chemotaxis protein [Allopusillimonas soli]NYT35493.1 PAS domain-containing protein [Allopusillimonas soli]TEA75904.1 PAS domain-containing methyl-accepting chemotaxis protein [Allopusillimonas soli]